jgi:hypothetical protein
MTDIRRVKRGIPTGGEFSPNTRDDASVILSSTTLLSVTVPIEWVDMVLPSPRHRTLQPVTRKGFETAAIRCFSLGDAPEAFTVPEYGSDDASLVRVIDGRLYAQPSRVADQERVTEEWMVGSLSRIRPGYREDERTVRDEYMTNFDEQVSIDGDLWEESRVEPRYKVMTFGMGDNHGGTSLMYETSSWSNVASEDVFLADEYEAAVNYALAIAEKRGDTRSIASIGAVQPIIVHAGVTVGATAARTTRLVLPLASDTTVENFGAVKAEYIVQLSSIPGAIVAERGRKRIDFTKLTDRQASSARRLLLFGAENGLL